MIELLGISALSFLAALSGAVVPGPVFALVVSESLKSGRIAGPLIVIGHFIIEWLIIFIVFLGFGPLLESTQAKLIVSYVGGTLLMLMGLQLIREAFHLKIDEKSLSKIDPNRVKRLSQSLVASGFLSSCSNPYTFIWWSITGIPLMMSSISIAGTIGFILFLAGHAAADLVWFSLVGYSVYKGGKILGKKSIQAILFLSAVFLMVFAAYLIISSLFRS